MLNFFNRAIIGILVGLPLSAAVADDGFRCGSRIVTIGMTQAEVLAHCGVPSSKAEETVPVRSGPQVVGTTHSSRWTYSSWGATRVLVFDQDRLVGIQ